MARGVQPCRQGRMISLHWNSVSETMLSRPSRDTGLPSQRRNSGAFTSVQRLPAPSLLTEWRLVKTAGTMRM